MSFSKIRIASVNAVAGGAMLAGLAALSATSSQAQMAKPRIDPGHTSVHFSVGHGKGTSPTLYQFRELKKVDFYFDPKHPTKSHISIVINAASLDSNHYFRDNWARSAAELNVWKFPNITFVSTKVVKTGANKGRITGNLTLHGVTKQITATIVHHSVKHFSGKDMVHGFVATGTFKRSDFGLKAFTPWISDQIKFTVILEQKRPIKKMMKK